MKLRLIVFKDIIYLFILILLSSCVSNSDSLIWYNPENSSVCVIQNRGWNNEIGNKYIRLPDRAKELIRPEVWELSRNSSGLTLLF